MDLSISGEIPLTSWFNKTDEPRTVRRPIKRRQTGLDSSPPVKKSKLSTSTSSKAVDERAPSSSKKTTITSYMRVQVSGHTQTPHTPHLKSLSRNNASLPTPPDSARPVIKPHKTLLALFTPSEIPLKGDTIFTDTSDSRLSNVFASSSEVIEVSDDEDMCQEAEVLSSQYQGMDSVSLPSPDDFVSSSQSQLLDVWENPSPRKNKHLKRVMAVEPTLELIPSSQSQEWDLGTPYYTARARFENPKTVTRPDNSNLFDLSDMSVQDDPIGDICAELDAMASERVSGTNRGDSPSLEVDHDFEGPQLDENQSISQPVLSPLGSVANHPPNYHTSPSPSSRSPQQVADCQESLPTESLPEEVRDFLDMFGSGDESYPPGFPESLKD